MEVTDQSVEDYIETLKESRKNDIVELVSMMQKHFSCAPKMWGSIIGFGHVKYEYKTGNGGEMPILSMARRQKNITLYLSYDVSKYPLDLLGKVTHGKGCLYIKSLADINKKTLEKILFQAKEDLLKESVIKEVIDL